ncbi:hypothetical protein [Flavobacterium sp. WC2509]|uniref:hypothetical protein n=1 Tax=Flavobacterium sp. WC2509 TaxID=3461406 RepID=UPI004044C17F
MTLTELRDFSNTKLGDASDITAAEHREVNNAIFDFIGTLLPLAEGSFDIGDVTTTDNVRTVTFSDVGTDNYRIRGSLVYKGTDFNNSNDVSYVTGEYTRTSFKIGLREISPNIQNLRFDWELKPNN